MEDWSKGFWEIVETMAYEFEQFCEEVEETVEAIADEMERSLLDELDQFVNEVLEPTFLFYEEYLNDEDEDLEYWSDWSLPTYKEATPNHQPTCQGCKHYHGQVYNGQILVCGMYPYGVGSSHCPDWEK